MSEYLAITQEDEQWMLQNIIENRTFGKSDLESHRPLSQGFEKLGVMGEFAFASQFGLPLNVAKMNGGDNGVDFRFDMTVDVKTAQNAPYLIVEEGKVRADIYVLSEANLETQEVKFIGWTWRSRVLKAPVDDGTKFKNGIKNHYIPKEQLFEMELLNNLINKGKP